MDLPGEMMYPTPVAGSPLLPMLLMSLMTQKNAPEVKKTFKDEYDYIIVGGGSAGSVLANRLSEKPCVNVLLLEAGKRPPVLTDIPLFGLSFWYSDIDWAFKTVPQTKTAQQMVNQQVIWPQGKVVGGSSVINANLYVRGNMKDYNDWAANGATGWSYDDVFPYFLKIENYTVPQYINNGFHSVGGPITVERPNYEGEIKQPLLEAAQLFGYDIVDINGPKQTGFTEQDMTIINQQRCSAAKGYLVPVENRPNLDIIAKAYVKKIVIENGRAVGVIFDFGGETHQVKATREVIVSAGAVNTPKILMLSGIGPEKLLQELNIPVLANLPVGENLQDHVGSLANYVLDSSIPPFIAKITSQSTVKEYIDNRRGPFTSSEGIATMAFLTNDSNVSEFPNYQLYFLEAAAFYYQKLIPLKPEVYKQVYEQYEFSPLFVCMSSMLHPKSRGTITLKSTDPYDPPIIEPNYFDVAEDMDDMVEGMKTCAKIIASDPLKKVGPKPIPFGPCEEFLDSEDKYFECQIRSVVFSYSHYVGTAKMGCDTDAAAVVDLKLRVRGIEGLRVVDSSIMPTVPSGNTNIPTMMIAEKASDIIKETIEC